MKPFLPTAALLTASNAFMTIAWYGHLNFEQAALWKVVLVSWLIALLEYCFQVPANRWGHEGGISSPQLKVMQEVITLVVFSIFAVTYLNERIRWNHFVAFGLVLAAVFVVFYDGPAAKEKPGPRHLARPGLSHE
jgi:uncharacterized protein (DUF486 family)